MNKTLRILTVAMTAIAGGAAFADGWVKPVPEAYVPDFSSARTEVYAYNLGAGQFMAQGNDWNTRWSVAEKPNRLYVTYFSEEDADREYYATGAYLLQDSAHNYGGTYSTQYYINMEDDPGAAWVDQSSTTHAYWDFVWDEANKTFRLRPTLNDPTYGSENYAEGKYFAGVNGNSDDTRIYPLLNIEDENASKYYIDWIFINPATFNYAEYQEKYETYNASQTLLAKIEEAKEAGINVSAAEAVYADTSSDKAALQAATQEVEGLIANNIEQTQDPKNPTLYYEQDFNTDFSGWTSTTGAQNNVLATNQCDTDASLTGGANFDGKFWENWNGSAFSGKMYTTLENVPNGIYQLSLGAFCQDNKEALYVYMNNDSVQLTQTDPNTYKIAALVTDGTIEMGLKQVEARTQWMGIDNAKLYYYGNSAGAYAVLLQSVIDGIDYDAIAEAEYNATDRSNFIDAYTAASNAVQAAEDGTISKDEVLAKKEDLVNKYTRAKNCADAYAELKEYMNSGDLATIRDNNEYEAAAEKVGLFDYVDEVESGIEDGEYTLEELAEIKTKLATLVDQAIKGSLTPGTDLTILIQNPNFDNGTIDGWTQEGTYPKFGYGLCEVYEGEFKLYQTLTGLETGVYKIECQAFVRAGSNADAESAYLNDDTSAQKSYIYGNADRTLIKNLYADQAPEPLFQGYNNGTLQAYGDWPSDYQTQSGGGVPNSLEGASYYFDEGYYKNEVYVFVNDGTLELGFAGESAATYYWTLFDNFKLTYMGADPEYIAPLVQAFVDQANEITEAGDPASATVLANMTDAVDKANAAIEANDGEELIAVYPVISGAVQDAQASVKAYASLYTAIEDAQAAVDELEKSKDAQDTFDEAIAGIQEKYADGVYADSEIEGAIAEVEAALAAYKTSGIQPDDDVSYLLKNYDFSTTGGWDGDALTYDETYQNAEFYNKAFHAYQKLTGVPNGTYELEVLGYYRSGSNQECVDEWVAGTANQNNWVGIYLNDEYKKLPSQASGAEVVTDPEDAYLGGTQVANGSTYYFVPNTRQIAHTYMSNDMYQPITITAVVTDGVLEVGMQKTSTKNTDWALFDYFKLTYKSASTDANGDGEEGVGIEDVKTEAPANGAIYDLSGRRVSKAQKGIYIQNGIKVVVK
jgi:hypothetical protein